QRRRAAQMRQAGQSKRNSSAQSLMSQAPQRQRVKARHQLLSSTMAVSANGTNTLPVLNLDRQRNSQLLRHAPRTQRQGIQRNTTVSTRPRTPQQVRLHLIRSCLRLGLFGLGVSALAGTLIAILHPAPHPGTLASSRRQLGEATPNAEMGADAIANTVRSTVATAPVLVPSKELKEAKAQVQALAAAQSGLLPGMFFYNPDNGAYLDINGDKSFSAASTIKLPIFIAFFQDVDAGKIRLDEQLTMRKDLIASESGDMQYQSPGTKFSALETADKMITISDNTATNMIIDRLGGAAQLNQRFKLWGLTQTVLRNPLPDLQGTNTISPKDLSTLMLKISQGELLTPHSRDRALDILRHTITNTLLPPGLGEGATIAHKTGDIGSIVGDAGLIDMPNGQRYVATVMVQRPHNDSRAQELIRQISKVTYQALSQRPSTSPASSTSVVTPSTSAVSPSTSAVASSNSAVTPSTAPSPLPSPISPD
ncbi:MAG TPA: serine hydrolase, partial [Stenomitos sp.]